jgi:hypothetical protein
MEIQNIFLDTIWLCGFLVLCIGVLWTLKTILDSVVTIWGKTDDKKGAESFIEEINDIDLNINGFSDRVPDENED